MPTVKCTICLSHHAINNFVVFLCGHGFCTNCKDRIFQESAQSKCPNCRVGIRARDAHPVFLELVDSKALELVDSNAAFVSNLVNGLDKMNHETPLLSVKRAGQKLGKVLQGPQLDSDATTTLIRAVQNFDKRILPLFTKLEGQTQQIVVLRRDFHESRVEAQALHDQAEQSQKHFIELEIKLKETKQNEDEAIRLAEIAKNEVIEVHENLIQWKKRTSEFAGENKRCKDLLEKQVEAARLQREKKNKLRKQVAKLTQELAAAKEKEIMSDVTQDYDGDFSTHEHSMMQSSMNVTSTPTAHHFLDENHIDLDTEGMPPPRFPSEWQLNRPTCGALKNQSLNGAVAYQRATNTFPIDLDRKGRPTKAVQLGPRPLIHIARRNYRQS